MNVFSGVTSADLGAITSSNIVESGFSLLIVLAPVILIGLAIVFAPKIIRVIKIATGTRYYKNWDEFYSSFTKEEKKYSDMFMKDRGRNNTKEMNDRHARSMVKKKGIF